MKTTLTAALVAMLLAIGTEAFANATHPSFIDVPGSVSFDGWNELNRTGLGGGDQTTATAALNAGVVANVAGSGDAVLNRISGAIYPAGAGLYQAGVLTFTDSTVSSGITSLVLQGFTNNFDTPESLQSSLSYNGGTQSLIPTQEVAGSYYVFSWDLTGIAETIDSYAITFSQGFAQSLAFQVDQVSVPEPGSFVLLCVAGAALACQRRLRVLA